MLSNKQAWLKSVLQTVLIAPSIATAIVLVHLNFIEINKKPSIAGVFEALAMFCLIWIAASFLGYWFGAIPAAIAGTIKHYLMNIKGVGVVGFTIVWTVVFGCYFAAMKFYSSYEWLASAHFFIWVSFFTGLVYVWAEYFFKIYKLRRK